jgi:hypothetical protein
MLFQEQRSQTAESPSSNASSVQPAAAPSFELGEEEEQITYKATLVRLRDLSATTLF